MQQMSPETDLVAVACVVESSLTLATEWTRILFDYVSPMLKRLNEIHNGYQVTASAPSTDHRRVFLRR